MLVPQVLWADVFADLDVRRRLEHHADGHRCLVDGWVVDGDLVDELPALFVVFFDGQTFDHPQGRAAGVTSAFTVGEDVRRLDDGLRALPGGARQAGAARRA